MPETNDLFSALEVVLDQENKDNNVIEVDIVKPEVEEPKDEDKKENLIDVDSVGETTEKEEEEGNDVEVTSDKEEKKDSASIYKPLAEYLKEEEILPSLDLEKFDGTPEGLKEAMMNELQEWKESFIEQLHPAIKELQMKYEEGVPLDELISVKSDQIRFDNISDDDLEDENLQKDLVAYHLSQTTRWSDAKIKKEIERLSDVSELKDEASEALKELRHIAKEQEAIIEARAKEEERMYMAQIEEYQKTLQDTVKNTTEIIPGVKLSDKEKQHLQNLMTKPVEIRGDQRISKAQLVREQDPIGFEMKLNYFIEKGFFDGKFDTITNKAKTNALQELERQTITKIKKTGMSNFGDNAVGDTILNQFNKIKNK